MIDSIIEEPLVDYRLTLLGEFKIEHFYISLWNEKDLSKVLLNEENLSELISEIENQGYSINADIYFIKGSIPPNIFDSYFLIDNSYLLRIRNMETTTDYGLLLDVRIIQPGDDIKDDLDFKVKEILNKIYSRPLDDTFKRSAERIAREKVTRINYHFESGRSTADLINN